jgi:hypothetical protein
MIEALGHARVPLARYRLDYRTRINLTAVDPHGAAVAATEADRLSDAPRAVSPEHQVRALPGVNIRFHSAPLRCRSASLSGTGPHTASTMRSLVSVT